VRLDRAASARKRVELSPFDIHLDKCGCGFCGQFVNRNALHHDVAVGCKAGTIAAARLKAQFAAFGAYGDVQRANPGGDGASSVPIHFVRRSKFCGSASIATILEKAGFLRITCSAVSPV